MFKGFTRSKLEVEFRGKVRKVIVRSSVIVLYVSRGFRLTEYRMKKEIEQRCRCRDS
jgi:hypothetical protein